MEKKNDWLASLFFNPDKGVQNFIDAGFNTDNTVMYLKEYYKNIQLIQDKFKKEDGQFDELAFDDFYDSALRTYNGFVQEQTLDDGILNNYFGFFNPDANGQGRLPVFGITKVANPELRSRGITSLKGYGDPTRSMREAAQTNYVRDSKGNKLDYTPNDDDRRGLNFFKNKPLYYARWEEDGIHLNALGLEVNHIKGEYKLDENDMPYLQELERGEDVSSKELLKLTDTLTIDGSKANDWDFLEGDSVDKSAAKSVAKMVATVAPLFIPGVGEVYAWAMIAANFSKAASTIAKAGIEAFDLDYQENDVWNLLNNIEGYTKSYTDTSVSDRGGQSFWNMEQLTNFAGDIATLGAEQRAIAKGGLWFMKALGYDANGMNMQKKLIQKYGKQYLEKYGKSLEKAFQDLDVADDFLNKMVIKKFFKNKKAAEKLARSSSSLYMALTQSADIVDTMKANNYDSKYTAAATVAAILGFKKIMDSELGDVALKGLGLDKLGKEVSKNVKNLVKDGQKEYTKATTEAGKLTWIKSKADEIYNKTKNLMDNSEFMESALKEGTEEVTEELLLDAIMKGADTIAWSLKTLGVSDIDESSWSYLKSNPLERYLTAFAGGAIGGPITRGIDIAKNWKAYKQYKLNKANKKDLHDFLDLIRIYGKEPVLKELRKNKNKKLFPTTLSLNSEDGKTFLPSLNGEDSQNNILFDYLEDYINYWDTLIHEEGLSVSDELLIDEATWKDARVAALRESGLGADVIDTFNDLLVLLANANLKYRELYNTIDPKERAGNSLLAEVKKTADDLRQQIQDLRSGLKASDFLDKAVFKMSRSLNSNLYTPDIYMFANKLLGIDYAKADEELKKEVDKKYQDFLENNKNVDDLAYKVFTNARDLLQSDIKGYKENDFKYFNTLRRKLNDLFKEDLIEGLVNPSEEELKALVDQEKAGKSDDEIILERNLNPKDKALSEEQKSKLVNDAILEDIQFKINLKSEEAFNKYFQLGLDTRFFGDIDRLNKVINVLQEIKKQFGYLDTDTVNKINLIIDKVNNKDFSLENLLNSFINSNKFGNLVFKNLFNDLDSDEFKASVANILKPILNLTEASKSDDFDAVELLDNFIRGFTISKNINGDDTFFDLVFLDSEGNELPELKYRVNQLSSSLVFSLLKDLINIDTNIQSLEEYSNNNNPIILKIKELTVINETALNLINTAKSLLENNSGKDVVTKLIKKISESVYGYDVSGVSEHLLKALTSSKSIHDFTIQDPSIIDQLEVLYNSINLAKSIIIFSSKTDNGETRGLFDNIKISNDLRLKNGLELLQELNFNEGQELLQLLNELETAAKVTEEISKLNREGKLKENKLVHTKVMSSWILILANNPKLKSIKLNDKEFFDYNNFDTERLEVINKALSGFELTREELIILEEVSQTIHQHYYDKFQELSEEDKKKLIDLLAKLNPFGSLPVKLNKDFKSSEIDNDSLVNYVLTTITLDPTKFNNSYALSIKEKDFDNVVPLYSQRLVVELAVAAFTGNKYINYYLGKVSENFPNFSFNQYLPNHVFVSGTAGCGKTKVIAKLFNNIIKSTDPNVNIISYAWKADRAKELSEVLGINKDNNYSEFNIYKKWFDDDTIEEIKKFKRALSLSPNTKKENLKDLAEYTDFVRETDFTKKSELVHKKCLEFINKIKPENISKNKEVIIIDEYTHLSNFELMLLGNIKNLFLLDLGDLKQEGFNGFLKNGGSMTSFATFYMDMSVRPNNSHKKDNLNRLATIIDTILRKDEAYKIGNGGLTDVSTIINIMKKNGFFKYTETDGQIFGEKVVQNAPEASEIKNMINHLKDGENIAYIYDELNAPNKEISDLENTYKGKFILVKSGDVLGSEYTYTIINANYPTLDNNDTPAQTLMNLKKLFTMISRSKEGSIIVKTKSLVTGTSQQSSTVSRDTFNAQEIEEYKNFISGVFEGIGTQENPTVTKESNQETTKVDPTIKTSVSGTEALRQVNEKDATYQQANEGDTSSFKVFLSHIMYNVGNGSNRNLGKWDSVDDKILESFNLLKNLIFRRESDLEKLLNSDQTFVIERLKRAFELFSNNSDYKDLDDIKDAILNGNYFILKVKYSDEYKSEDNGINSNVETPTYVYRIYRTIGDWEIDLGVISNPENISNEDIKTKLITANENQKFLLDKNKMNIKFNKTKITKTDALDYNNNSIPEFLKKNSWANISNRIWVPNKKSNYEGSLGYPIILYSRDMFESPDEFRAKFEKRIATGENNGIVALRPSLHGYTFKEYMHAWRNLYHLLKGKNSKVIITFKSFSGHRQPIRIYRQLLRFLEYLKARSVKGSTNESIKEALKLYYKESNSANAEEKLNHDIELYNSKITDDLVAEYLNNVEKLFLNWKSKLSKLDKSFRLDLEDLLNMSFSKLTNELIKHLNSNNLVKTFREYTDDTLKEAIKSVFPNTPDDKFNDKFEIVKRDIDNFIKLYDKYENLGNEGLANPMTKFKEDDGSSPFTNVSGEMIDWLLSQGYALSFIGGTMLTHHLSSTIGENESLMNLVSIAIDNTAQFKDGIWSNGVISDGKKDGFYLSNGTIEDLYFNSLIEIPDAFIDLNSIQFEENKLVDTNEEEKSNSTENDLNSILNRLSLGDEFKSKEKELKDEITKKVENRSDKNESIESFLNGQYFTLESGEVFISSEDDGEIKFIPLNNDNVDEIKNLKVFKELTNSKLKSDITNNLSGGTFSYEILKEGIYITLNSLIEFLVNDKEIVYMSESNIDKSLSELNNSDITVNDIEEAFNKLDNPSINITDNKEFKLYLADQCNLLRQQIKGDILEQDITDFVNSNVVFNIEGYKPRKIKAFSKKIIVEALSIDKSSCAQ